jgi:hypothetical protein
MNRPLPTFSSLPRATRCLASAALPACDEESDHAEAGTVRHHFLRRVSDLVRTGMALAEARTIALAEAPADARWELGLLDLAPLRLGDVMAEVAFAIDIVTGEARVLGRAIDRHYDAAGRRPTEVCGSVDAVALVGQEGARVRDYKGRSHDRRPDQDEQLLAGAYAVMRIYRRRWVDVEVVRIVSGRAFPVKARVSAPDLERFGQRLRALGARVQEARAAFTRGVIPDCTRGDHCAYCPGMRSCPAMGALARAALGGELAETLARARAGLPLVTEEDDARLHEQLASLERVVRALKTDLRDRARGRPIPLRNGKVYGLTRSGQVRAYRAQVPEALDA